MSALILHSWELDNYDGPDATLSGRIIDKETGELVEQDIIRGTQIEFIEHGYDNPLTQYMVIKNDGTYANKMMFANDYTIQIRSANFPATEPVEITIKGNTTYDFEVIPYLRIKDVQIKIEGDEVVATAKVEKTTGHKITRIGLYAHQNQQVGEQMRPIRKTVDMWQAMNADCQFPFLQTNIF